MKRIKLANSTWFLILASAAAYFVAGRLALLLAIPPGYATAVWPAAGVALAAVMLCGYRLWPGILLGSFLVNASMGFDVSDLFKSTIIPLAIGSGAALQATTGAWLVRRYISADPALDSMREVSLFIMLAVGLSSMVNATIGTGTLLLAGIVSLENFSFNWATWWTGDAIGILIFTVLLLTFFGKLKEVWRPRRITIAIPLIFCFLAVVVVFVYASKWEVSQQRMVFQSKAEKLYLEMEQVIAGPQDVLNAISGLFLASDNVSRDEFATYVERPLRQSVGIQALAWVPRVDHARRQAMESRARSDGLQGFEFSEAGDRGLTSAADRPLYFPVYYLEPLLGNEKALGFDLASNPSRLAAMETAIRTRSITSTESIKLVQESGDQRAIIMFLPLFAGPDSADHLGFVDVVFRLTDLVKSALTDAVRDGVVMTLSEITEQGHERRLLATTEIWPEMQVGKEVDRFKWEKDLDIGNRLWKLKVVANQDLLTSSRTLLPWSLLAGGLLFSGLLGAFLLYVTGATYRATNAADVLRKALSELKEAQTQLVESEKLASLGGMMSGLAHELNTPVGIAVTAVTTIEGKVNQLKQKLDTGELGKKELYDLLDIVSEGSKITHGNLERAALLVKSFKDVTVDRATGDTREIHLEEYCLKILEYMKPSHKRSGHKIELACPFELKLTTVPGGLSQVIINLLNNSLMHAFSEGVAGHIWISAEAVNDQVKITFEDDGKGIPEQDRSRVFDAYFSTRKGSGGTGLGLHLVKNIVESQLQGSITLKDRAGGGVVFEILLPTKLSG